MKFILLMVLNTKALFLNRKGFTLIELLVVFSIIAILSGIGIVSFSQYSRVQQVSQAANNFKLLVNEARFNSLSTVKSNKDYQGASINCITLNSYTVVVVGTNELDLNEVCSNTTAIIKQVILPQNISFGTGTSCTTIAFNALNAMPSGSPLPCTIKLSGYNLSKNLVVDAGGNASVAE